MTSAIEQHIDVSGFAAVINSRLSAEARIARAIGFAWLSGGAAIGCCLGALGLLSALYGYSYMISVKPAAEQTAKALVQALERSQLTTIVSGTMSLAPNSELKLTDGQKVRLEEGAMVKLAANSSVRVIGDLNVDMPQPSNGQLQLDTRGKSNDLPFTSYTIFRSVPYASGEVATGWAYELSDRQRPKAQYCYYATHSVDKRSTKYQIAFDGVPQRATRLEKAEFDGALGNCIWFPGG
jgi:hypothetical protein